MPVMTGIPDSRACCYNCIHFKMVKSSGICKFHGEELYNATEHICADHEETPLVRCNECGGNYRNLGLHVKSHGMTAAEYKEKYGFNRHTSLSCPVTQKMVGEAVSEERREMLRERMKGMERKGHKGIKLRPEARVNFSNKVVTDETRKRMSDAQKGKSKGKGVPKSDEHRAKISAGLKSHISRTGRTIIRNEKGQIITYKKGS